MGVNQSEIDRLSLSDKDIGLMIDSLSKNVATNMSEQQNTLSDNSLNGTLASKIAKNKLVRTQGNKQVVQGATRGMLTGAQSKIDAGKFLLQKEVNDQIRKNMKEQQERDSIMGMFANIGIAIGANMLLPGSVPIIP